MNQSKKNISVQTLKRRNFLIVFGISAATILFVLWFMVFCRVKTVTVKNNNAVPTAEIVSAANIKENKHLFSIRENKTANAVKALSPYVRAVTVTRNLPSDITITVEEYKAAYHVFKDGICYLLSDSLFVLAQLSEAATEAPSGALLMVPTIKEIEVGKTIVFEKKTDDNYVKNALTLFSESTFSDMITALYLDNQANIKAELGARYQIRFASAIDLEKKIALCEGSVHYLKNNMYAVKGILHATSAKEVTFEMTGILEQS